MHATIPGEKRALCHAGLVHVQVSVRPVSTALSGVSGALYVKIPLLAVAQAQRLNPTSTCIIHALISLFRKSFRWWSPSWLVWGTTEKIDKLVQRTVKSAVFVHGSDWQSSQLDTCVLDAHQAS